MLSELDLGLWPRSSLTFVSKQLPFPCLSPNRNLQIYPSHSICLPLSTPHLIPSTSPPTTSQPDFSWRRVVGQRVWSLENVEVDSAPTRLPFAPPVSSSHDGRSLGSAEQDFRRHNWPLETKEEAREWTTDASTLLPSSSSSSDANSSGV